MPRDHEHPPLTKILATLGPATDDRVVLRKLVDAGATLFRLNFSHGLFDEHLSRLRSVRAVAEHLGVPLAVVGDLPGPKIRLGTAPEQGIILYPGQDVIVRAGAPECVPGEGERLVVLGCNYAGIAREVKGGERVLINDGAIRMLAIEATNATELLCRVKVGGLVTSRKGLNLPDSNLTIPALTEKDRACVEWAVRHGLEYLALSFVRRAADVVQLREFMKPLIEKQWVGTALGETLTPGAPRAPATPHASMRIPIIAKIETPQAVQAIEEILEVSDALMVARGDLGVEMDVARVPMIQKRLISAAHEFGRPVVVATQMLESMITAAHPTRAEVSDVANAILDGADAIMLSGETAVGKYPALAVETMRRVALATEESIREHDAEPNPPERLRKAHQRVPALAHGAWHMAHDVGAKLIAVWSHDGGAARYLSRNGFNVPILAFSSDEIAVRRMALLFSVSPVLVSELPVHRSDFAAMVDRFVIENNWAKRGDQMVLLAGKPFDDPRATSTVAIRTVGELTPE